MFCAGNAKEKININKNIINAENYLDDNIAGNNNLTTDQESASIELWNHKKNTENSFEELFANMYKNNKLIQAIIDTKVRSIRKFSCKILKQVKLSMRNLKIKNSKLYMQSNIYVLDNQNLWLYLLRQ